MEWLRELLKIDLAYHATVAVIIVIVFTLLSRTVRAVLRWAAHKVFARTKNVLDDRLVAVVLAHVRPLLVLTSLHIAIREVRKALTPADETLLQVLEYGASILYVVFIILIVKIIVSMVRETVDWYLGRIYADGTSDLQKTLGPLTSKVANLVVGMIAIIVLLDHFGVNIGSLLVSLGVGSLAVALAAQDTLANVIAGFVILVDRPFRVGDRVELQTGVVGDVREIGLRSTRLINFDNNLIIIPNAELVKSRIINYDYPHTLTRILLKFNVAQGTEPDRVRRILLELAVETPGVMTDPPPEVHFTAINDFSLEFTLVARTRDYKQKFDIENLLRERVYKKFAEQEIEFPYPQRVVHMKSDV